jgi:hypothetical protein
VNQIALRLRDLKWSARIDALPTLNAAANLIEKIAALHRPVIVVRRTDGNHDYRCSCGLIDCRTAALLHQDEPS